jgi:thymidine phosphorylase
LDIKTGRGAFMHAEEDSINLARTLIDVGRKFGKRTIAFLTDMNQPLGHAVGNWLEIVECIDCLKGKDVPDLMEVTYVLGGAMVMLGGKAATIELGVARCREAIASGAAWRKFLEVAKRQGADTSFLEHPERYPASRFQSEIRSANEGDVDNIDALEIGFAGIMLHAGRMKVGDVIDPKAGILFAKKVGDSVNAGELLATLYCDDERQMELARHRVQKAINVATEPSVLPPLIRAMIDEQGVHPWHGLG